MDSALHHLEASLGFARLRTLTAASVDLSAETLAMIFEAAEAFGQRRLGGVNRQADAGCTLTDGRVRTPAGYAQVWRDMVAEGWASIDFPETWGGQGLPLTVQSACQEAFDRGCVAFCMLLTPQRAGFRLLEEHAPAEIREEWLPRMAEGEWTTTICISEPEAGSDVGRIRTLATPDAEGGWRITGEKCWISFGDHDLSGRIGHCLLARTPGAPAGGRGLSLFLVPNLEPVDTGALRPNGVVIRRMEEKLGLHGSPTCSIGFENAKAYLLGHVGRGLPQMFTMIGIMRQSVSVQGLGVAAAAADIAWRYARERRQGGDPDAPPVPITAHADVQRMLLDLSSRVEMLRGVTLELAVQMDLARIDHEGQAAAADLAQWLMPIAKTYGAETATWAAGETIQVLGGAGYTKEWPVEQLFRDSRVFAIYEGTSGVQALDLLHRRLWRDGGAGLKGFCAAFGASAESATAIDPSQLAMARYAVERLLVVAARLDPNQRFAAEASALAFLRLAAEAATAWVALRLLAAEGPDADRLQALAAYWLTGVEGRVRLSENQALGCGEAVTDAFARVNS